MLIVYVGGPVDGLEDPYWRGPLPEIMYVPRRPVRRFVKSDPPRLPMPLSTVVHRYRLRDCIGDVASYVFVS